MSLDIYEKYNVLVKLIKNLNDNKYSSGNTHIQKLIYFLQNIKNIDLNYEYFIYLYGPYSEELKDDIHFLRAVNILYREAIPNGFGVNYYIDSSAEDIKNLLKKDLCEDEINYIVDNFGKYNVSDLELLSTLHFVSSGTMRNINKEEIFNKVKRLKPHFTKRNIEKYWKELNKITDN